MGKIIHWGIVVEDVEKAVEIYETVLGIGPWEFKDDREFFARMHYGDGYEMELVMPTGEGVYADWLREKGPGLHHIKFETNDSYRAIIETSKKVSGRPPYLKVEWPDGRPLVAYADLLKETGLLIEVSVP